MHTLKFILTNGITMWIVKHKPLHALHASQQLNVTKALLLSVAKLKRFDSHT